MPRKTKYPKLPNGFGQIRHLGKGRRNPYGVYPPSVEEYDNGQKKTPPALCYVSDRMVGLAVLTSYHAGTYKPGDEIMIEKQMRSAEVGKRFLMPFWQTTTRLCSQSSLQTHQPLKRCLKNTIWTNSDMNMDTKERKHAWSILCHPLLKILPLCIKQHLPILRLNRCRLL